MPVPWTKTLHGRDLDASIYQSLVLSDRPRGQWRLEEDLSEVTADQNSRDFETTIGVWVANSGMSSVARSTTTAHAGSGSAKAISNGGANQGAFHSSIIPCGGVGNRTFTYTVWVYGSTDGDALSLFAYFYNNGNFATSIASSIGVVPQAWTQYTWTFDVPNAFYDGFRPAIHFDADGGAVGQFFYFDDVSVKKGNGHSDGGSDAKAMNWTTGAPTYRAEGKYGYGVVLSATQIATAPAATDFAFSTGSLEAWIKAASPGVSYRGILTKQNAFGMFLLDGVAMAYDWGEPANQSSGVNVADGNWHHMVYTFEPGAASIYVDTVKTNFVGHAVAGQAARLTIGAGLDTAIDQAFTGSIDECAIYDYRLTDQQVAQHYRLGKNMGDWAIVAGAVTYDVPTATWTIPPGGQIRSPLLRIAGYENWTVAADFFTDGISSEPTFAPDGGMLWGSHYIAEDRSTSVVNSTGFTDNGNAQSVPLSTWTRRSWSYFAGATVAWIYFTIVNDGTYVVGGEKVRKFQMTIS